MDEPVRILCVDDERNVLRALERLFLDDDYQLLTAASGAEGLEILDLGGPVQVVLSDYRMPGLNGVEFLREVRRRRPETVRIVLSGYADTAAVVAAINDGQIYKFIPKPWNDDDLKVTIANALEKYFLGKKNRQLLGELRASNDDLVRINERLESIVQERVAGLMIENRQLALIRLLLEELPLPVLACDPQGRVIYRNRAGEGLPVGDILPPALRSGYGRTQFDGVTFFLRAGRLAADDGELTILTFLPEGTGSKQGETNTGAKPFDGGKTMENSILLVDDEAQVLNALGRALMDENYTVCTAGNAEDALRMLESRRFKVIVCDERMPGMSGAELLSLASMRHPEMVRIMLTGHATLEAAMKAVNTGEIYRFFAKPWNDLELILSIRSAIEKYDLEMENRRLLAMLRTQYKHPEPVEKCPSCSTKGERTADGGFVLPEVTEEEAAALMEDCQVEPDDKVDSGPFGNKV